MDMTTYTAAKETASFYRIQKPGYLKISGADRNDFLQRQTTNDIEKLTIHDLISSVLTNPAARILDVLQVYIENEDTLGVLTLPGKGSETTGFLKGKIFFMDKVSVEDASTKVVLFELSGPTASKILNALNLPIPELGETQQANNADIRVLAQKSYYSILAPIEEAALLQKKLAEAGATALDTETYEILRVENKRPAHPNELHDGYTPLEIGLRNAISNSKGCYTGQEVIARQITYDKITKQLVQIKLKEAEVSTSEITSDSVVYAEGKKAGVLTSIAKSPEHGLLALAILKRPYHEANTVVKVEGTEGIVLAE